jgi:hypothetical protein
VGATAEVVGSDHGSAGIVAARSEWNGTVVGT